MNNARTLAINVLSRVAATSGYLNLVLDTALDESPLPNPKDAGLATELCYGATRRQLTLDYAILSVADRKLSALEDKVLAALRIGIYQLFYTRVPKHAAVYDTVEALKAVGLARAAGFVNALLRKLSALPALPLPDPSNEVGHLSIAHSHPEWLVKRWLRQLGAEKTREVLEANNTPAPLVLRANSSKITRDALLEQFRDAGLEAEATPFSPSGIKLSGAGRVEDLIGYTEGLFQVQDEAAQLVGHYAAVPDGARVLDACAAPGGKALHMAERLEVVACDLHQTKLRKILSERQRLGLNARLRAEAHDSTQPFPAVFGEFHAVMLDAPCTGLGTLRRHPELRYRREEADIGRLAALQRQLLENCQEQVPAGGLLTYAVCSLDPEEGADQVEMFLRSHPEFTAEPPTTTESKGATFPTRQGHLRTLPGPEGMDGFFAARLRKLY